MPRNDLPRNDQPRILITRLSAIGDCVHTMPMVSALRARFPNAFIAWAVQSAGATLLEGYPGLDEIIVVDRNWMKSWQSVREVRRRLQAFRFDVSLDPQSLTKSALLGWLSGAKQRIGFAKPQGRELSLWLNTTRITPQHDHVVDRYRELLNPIINHELPSVQFEMPKREFATVSELVANAGGSGNYVVLNPGAGWQSKTWVPSRFGEVAKHIHARYGLRSVVVWAGDQELAWAQEIVATAGESAQLAPDTSLPELAEVLRDARLCVAGDTGPLHIAVAVGTSCVGLYGTTQPKVCGPYTAQHQVGPALEAGAVHETVQAYFQDGSSRSRRQAANDAMQAIETATVTDACDRLLTKQLGRRVA